MNSKSRIFVEHNAVLFSTLLSSGQGISLGSDFPSIVDLLVFISFAYLELVTFEPEDEWVLFVFDTCSAIASWPNCQTHDISISSKREYLCNKYAETSALIKAHGSNMLLLISSIAVEQNSDSIPDGDRWLRFVETATSFAFSLAHIDRSITSSEQTYYDEIVGALSNISLDNERAAHDLVPGFSSISVSSTSGIEALLQEVEDLIGLDSIKAEVGSLVNLLRVQTARKSQGLPETPISRHMVFFGNPGTGKTTIARKLGLIYKELGILSKGHFVESDRADFVGGYLGQTAIKTKEVLDSASGGILFIDEAYTLTPEGGQDTYGQEAVDTILKYMEDNRSDIVVIVAGYEDRMSRFINSNPGLQSRFNKYLLFPDYTSAELLSIFLSLAKDSGYRLSGAASIEAASVIDQIVASKTEQFANGRAIRNMFERALVNHANRVAVSGLADKDDLSELEAADIRLSV